MAAIDRTALQALIGTNLADNTSGEITPQDVRDVFEAIKDSAFILDDDSDAAKTSLVDADKVMLRDSEATDAPKIITWANIKSALADLFVRHDASQSLTTSQQAQARANIGAGDLAGFRNKLYNPDGLLNVRGAESVSDDQYGHDRHYALTQTAAINVTTLTAPASGIRSMMRLTQTQASAQRMGYAQILPADDTYALRGQLVTLGGRLRYSIGATIRFAILEWTGTADAVTSDVVNNWSSGTFGAGGFFQSTSLAVTAVGSISPSANTITEWSLEATISMSANNLIVFYWTGSEAAQGNTLDMEWYLVEGAVAAGDVPVAARPGFLERQLCAPFCEAVHMAGVNGQALTTTDAIFGVKYQPKRTNNPSMARIASTVSVVQGTTTYNSDGGIDSSTRTRSSAYVRLTGFTGLTAGGPVLGSNDFAFLLVTDEL